MKTSDPPRLGVWLLEHFGPETNIEALTGDLLEGLSQGKSIGWYWRQIRAAIPWNKHLRYLLFAAGYAWLITWSDFWGIPRTANRGWDMAIVTIALTLNRYLPGLLKRSMRFVLGALIGTPIVIFFVWLYLYHRMLYAYPRMLYAYPRVHYLLPLGAIVICNLLFYRKEPSSSPHQITWREFFKRNPDVERKRLITILHMNMLRETDPELRQAYAQAISALQSDKNRETMPPQPRGPSLA